LHNVILQMHFCKPTATKLRGSSRTPTLLRSGQELAHARLPSNAIVTSAVMHQRRRVTETRKNYMLHESFNRFSMKSTRPAKQQRLQQHPPDPLSQHQGGSISARQTTTGTTFNRYSVPMNTERERRRERASTERRE